MSSALRPSAATTRPSSDTPDDETDIGDTVGVFRRRLGIGPAPDEGAGCDLLHRHGIDGNYLLDGLHYIDKFTGRKRSMAARMCPGDESGGGGR
jgi:hypothetical protein